MEGDMRQGSMGGVVKWMGQQCWRDGSIEGMVFCQCRRGSSAGVVAVCGGTITVRQAPAKTVVGKLCKRAICVWKG